MKKIKTIKAKKMEKYVIAKDWKQPACPFMINYIMVYPLSVILFSHWGRKCIGLLCSDRDCRRRMCVRRNRWWAAACVESVWRLVHVDTVSGRETHKKLVSSGRRLVALGQGREETLFSPRTLFLPLNFAQYIWINYF